MHLGRKLEVTGHLCELHWRSRTSPITQERGCACVAHLGNRAITDGRPCLWWALSRLQVLQSVCVFGFEFCLQLKAESSGWGTALFTPIWGDLDHKPSRLFQDTGSSLQHSSCQHVTRATIGDNGEPGFGVTKLFMSTGTWTLRNFYVASKYSLWNLFYLFSFKLSICRSSEAFVLTGSQLGNVHRL